jgi:hypothetical protein
MISTPFVPQCSLDPVFWGLERVLIESAAIVHSRFISVGSGFSIEVRIEAGTGSGRPDLTNI